MRSRITSANALVSTVVRSRTETVNTWAMGIYFMENVKALIAI